MAYDYSGSWSTVVGHQANLYRSTSDPATTPYNTDDAIRYYKCQGIAPSKITLGMPLYGHRFSNTDGLGKPFSDKTEFDTVSNRYVPTEGGDVHNIEQLGASYFYNETSRSFISNDNPVTAKMKAIYVIDNDIGGVMFWKLGDDRDGPKSLINITVDALGGVNVLDQTKNELHYPISTYNNVRSQFEGGHGSS